jgi:hypothetical protein
MTQAWGFSFRALRMMRRAFCSALEVTVQVLITVISAGTAAVSPAVVPEGHSSS